MDRFKERLKALRLENNLSQSALANKIKSSQKIIDYWEKGASEPSANFVIALADYFGVSCDFLLGREDEFGNVNVNSDLTEDEKILLSAYNKANKDGKTTILNFAKFLADKR